MTFHHLSFAFFPLRHVSVVDKPSSHVEVKHLESTWKYWCVLYGTYGLVCNLPLGSFHFWFSLHHDSSCWDTPMSVMRAELSQGSWLQIWACMDLFLKSDYRAVRGTLILSTANIWPFAHKRLLWETPVRANIERICHMPSWMFCFFFTGGGFNEEMQNLHLGQECTCWEEVHSLITEAETQSFTQVQSNIWIHVRLSGSQSVIGPPQHQETPLTCLFTVAEMMGVS